MLRADWTEVFKTRKKLESELTGFELPHTYFEGWIESPDDTVYVRPLGYPEVTGYEVQVWNNPTARAVIAEMLGKPVFRQKFGVQTKRAKKKRK